MRWHDSVREVDWARTVEGYAIWRPGYPVSFFHRLAGLGIGTAAQRILDLGTGTGVLAREFARRGAEVIGLDLNEELLDAARRLADEEQVAVTWLRAPAEATGLPTASVDVVCASEAWGYFDVPRAVAEVRRLLRPGGRLMLCRLAWLPRRDRIAHHSEVLMLRFNPHWDGADEAGVIRRQPDWARERFTTQAMFYYDQPMPFTRESWRGRLRACRGLSGELPAEQVAAFDAELAAWLESAVPPRFTVLHRLEALVLAPREHEA